MLAAQSQVNKGEFDEAALLLERLLYDAPADSLRAEVALSISRCYTAQRQFQLAEKVLVSNIGLSKDKAIEYNLYLQQCVVSLLSNNYEECLLHISQLRNLYKDSAKTADVRSIEILALNGKMDWQNAKTIYGEFVKDFAGSDSLQYMDVYKVVPVLKSEAKAEKLSVVPLAAAGLWYAGKPGEAILNTLLQAGFLYFGVHQLLAKEYISGVFIGVGLYASFYNGSSRRALKVIKSSNEKKTVAFNNSVRINVLKILLGYRSHNQGA